MMVRQVVVHRKVGPIQEEERYYTSVDLRFDSYEGGVLVDADGGEQARIKPSVPLAATTVRIGERSLHIEGRLESGEPGVWVVTP